MMDRDDMFSGLHEALQQAGCTSMEEVQAFARSFMERQNRVPLPEFHGLSPEQMHQFLFFPFDSPGLVSFVSPLEERPEAPIATLFTLLAEAIGEQGMKATATGNLPRNFCREAALRFLGEEGFRERTRYGGINKEVDFFDMHVTRLVANLSGLVHKYRGRFILTRECRKLLKTQGMAGIYPRLLRTYVTKFNWAYRDRHQALPFVQHAFLFTLHLLTRYGDDWRPHVFYEDSFLRAFPMILSQMEPETIFTLEDVVRMCYTWRTLQGFAVFFGLADVELAGKDGYKSQYRVRRRPLLAETVRFHTGAQ
jgi:hypothetical protein